MTLLGVLRTLTTQATNAGRKAIASGANRQRVVRSSTRTTTTSTASKTGGGITPS